MNHTNLESLYLQARAGDRGARAAMNDIKRRMRAGDVSANRIFDALSVIHWRSRSASEWATAGRLYDRMARKEPNVWRWADEVRQRAHAGQESAVRMYAMLRAIHMQHTTQTPETAGYNMRMRQVGFVVGNSPSDWSYLIELMQQALTSLPGIPLDDFITSSAQPQAAAPSLLGPARPSMVSSALAAAAARQPAPAPTLGKRKASSVTKTRTPECQAYYDLSVKLGTTNPASIQNHPMLIPLKAALQKAMDACSRSTSGSVDYCKSYQSALQRGQAPAILNALKAKCDAQRGF
jgi:hypothetical protein